MRHQTLRIRQFPGLFLSFAAVIAISGAGKGLALAAPVGPSARAATLTASGGSTIKKAAIVFTIDGIWGRTFWAGTFMHNSRMNLRLERQLEAGVHTLELMYRLQPPVSLTFTADSGTAYRIDEDEGRVVVKRESDGAVVGRAAPASTDPAAPPPQGGCRFVQPTRARTADGDSLEVIVLTVDGRFGPHASYPYRYIFNGPKMKDGVSIDLAPGEHEVELYGSDGKGQTRPGSARFTCEPGRTYGLELSVEEIDDPELRKVFSGILVAEVVAR
jgi:hypothetical protein